MNLLVLSASTGGGHDMRAYALSNWWIKKGGLSHVYHPLENTFVGYKFGCTLYNLIQKKIPRFHSLYFRFLEIANLHRNPRKIIGAATYIETCRAFNPDLIVSMHAHLNHGYFELVKVNLSKKVPFAVYCGELADGVGFSKHWVNPQNDLFIGPYQEGVSAAHRRGMPTDRTLVGGPLLREEFYLAWEDKYKPDVLSKYGLDDSKPIFLLGTGANGVNRHQEVIRAMKDSDIDGQVVALCGSNQLTYEKVSRIPSTSNLIIKALPKIEACSMVELLNISSWILARPGAGLTTEAIVTGCPVIFDLSGGCMPQERNNLNFWHQRTGDLITSSSPNQLVNIIRSGRKIPRLKIPMESSPRVLLDGLTNLIR
jgi:processive 1,2-diacylglycerol beta-glucosyltransferase